MGKNTNKFYSVNEPPNLPDQRWRHERPLLLEKEDGEVVIGFYAKVTFKGAEMIISGAFSPKWICMQPYHPEYGKKIDVKRWSYMPE